MGIKRLPCCFYPTSVVMVDDDALFLDVMQSGLEGMWPVVTCTEPTQLNTLLAQKPKQVMLSAVLRREADWEVQTGIDIDMAKLRDLLAQPERHDEVSVLVIDYEMPGMNGVQLAEQIQNQSIKKIMLTGEADHAIAIDAFNRGLIDHFILKDTPDLVGSLNTAIMEQQWRYFVEQTKVVMDYLAAQAESEAQALLDPEFANYLYGYMVEKGFCEFYLLDQQANFLLCKENGDTTTLLARTDAEIDDLLAAVDGVSNVDATLEKIQKRQALPFFYDEADYALGVDQWQEKLKPVNSVMLGERQYYIG